MVDRCKVSLHPPWAVDRKGEPGALRKVRDWQRVSWAEQYVQRDRHGWKTAEIILLALFKCHTPGRETFHMFFLLASPSFSNAPGFCCLGGEGGSCALGKPCGSAIFLQERCKRSAALHNVRRPHPWCPHIKHLRKTYFFWSLADSYIPFPDFFKNYPDTTKSLLIGREWSPAGSASHPRVACWWDSKGLQGAFAPLGEVGWEGDIKSEAFQEKLRRYRHTLYKNAASYQIKGNQPPSPSRQPRGVPKHNQFRLNTMVPTRLKLDWRGFIKGEFNCGAQSGCKIL